MRFFLWAWLGLVASALPVYAQDNLQSALDEILRARCLDPAQTAVHVANAQNGRTLYARNGEIPLLPASLMKIITTAAALHYLKPDYHFKTQLAYTGERQDDVISGDLVLRGGGDPMLTARDLWALAAWLKNSGITTVHGNLVGDAGFFDSLDRAPAWEESRTQRAYDARLSALSLDFNTIVVHALPGGAPGEAARVWLEPQPYHYRINTQALTVAANKKTAIWGSRREEADGSVIVTVAGSIASNAMEQSFRLNTPDPGQVTIATFRALLAQQGVHIEGATHLTHARSVAAHWLYQYESPPLSQILKELNTYSNNFMAEQIIKTIAAEITGQPGSHGEGLTLVRRFLSELGVATQDVSLADGSGLSRENRMSAQTITQVINLILPRFELAPDFVASLRIMGTEGSPKSRRFADEPLGARIRGKTGSLDQVSNLAGLVAGENGQVFAYTLLLNNNKCGPRRADELEAAMLQVIQAQGMVSADPTTAPPAAASGVGAAPPGTDEGG